MENKSTESCSVELWGVLGQSFRKLCFEKIKKASGSVLFDANIGERYSSILVCR